VRVVARRMAAAAQVGLACADAVEHALHDRHVHRLAAVAGAHQRQHLRVEAEAVHAAVLNEAERLQRLERRAVKFRPCASPTPATAARPRRPPRSTDVHALRKTAARRADQRDVVGALSSRKIRFGGGGRRRCPGKRWRDHSFASRRSLAARPVRRDDGQEPRTKDQGPRTRAALLLLPTIFGRATSRE